MNRDRNLADFALGVAAHEKYVVALPQSKLPGPMAKSEFLFLRRSAPAIPATGSASMALTLGEYRRRPSVLGPTDWLEWSCQTSKAPRRLSISKTDDVLELLVGSNLVTNSAGW